MKKIKPTKKLWLCTHCNSDNVEIKKWVNPNTSEVGTDCEDKTGYCSDCEEHYKLELVELKSDAHIIGYQVTGDGVKNAGEIHSGMLNGSCVYSLSQANEMLGKESLDVWALDAIWTGDIENPRMMFTGGIRD